MVSHCFILLLYSLLLPLDHVCGHKVLIKAVEVLQIPLMFGQRHLLGNRVSLSYLKSFVFLNFGLCLSFLPLSDLDRVLGFVLFLSELLIHLFILQVIRGVLPLLDPSLNLRLPRKSILRLFRVKYLELTDLLD